MQRLVEQLKQQVTDFIEQRDDLLLKVNCSSNDVAIVLQTFSDMEQASASDVFLLFVDDFTAPVPYASVIVERLRMQHDWACQALKESSRPTLPTFPDALLDVSRPTGDRLRDAMRFARCLLPAGPGHRLVWVMFPPSISDESAYREFIAQFNPIDGLKPWMVGMRLIIRNGSPQGTNGNTVTAARTRHASVDFGPIAMASAIHQEADDPALPMERRMRALFMEASLDSAHGRKADALQKYDALLTYYQQTKNLGMQALIMCGIGDLSHRTDDLEEAQAWYERALLPAADAKDAMVLRIIGKDLADVTFKRGEYSAAEQYYDGVAKLSAHIVDVEGQVEALEARGICQEKQGEYDRARESWEDAVTMSREAELSAPLQKNAVHLQRAYRALEMNDKAGELAMQIADLPKQEPSA